MRAAAYPHHIRRSARKRSWLALFVKTQCQKGKGTKSVPSGPASSPGLGARTVGHAARLVGLVALALGLGLAALANGAVHDTLAVLVDLDAPHSSILGFGDALLLAEGVDAGVLGGVVVALGRVLEHGVVLKFDADLSPRVNMRPRTLLGYE